MDIYEKARKVGENLQVKTNNVLKHDIDKSAFDKTFIGRVADKETYKDSFSNQIIIKRWLISANGKGYYVNTENSDIKSVGQAVRLYLPNNNKDKAFAEVVNPAAAPDKIVYTKNDERYDDYKEYGVDDDKKIKQSDVAIDTIVETWKLADKTSLERLYILTVINADKADEEVTSIVCPDGKQIMLEGF